MSDEIKRTVKETFSKNMEAYVQSSTHKNPTDLALIKEWLTPEKNWTVLDIATGGGHVAKALSSSVTSVFATDLTKDMLQNTARHLKDFKNIHFVVADAENLPFIDESFDAITCRIAPHHFPCPHLFIAEVYRVLKPGGRFLMIDNIAPEDDELDRFYNSFEKMRDKSHVRALKLSEWKQLMISNKLSLQKDGLRKKTLPFQEWVERTLPSNKAQQDVKKLMIEAGSHIKSYFSIIESENHISSFSIDEWMVLVEKDS